MSAVLRLRALRREESYRNDTEAHGAPFDGRTQARGDDDS